MARRCERPARAGPSAARGVRRRPGGRRAAPSPRSVGHRASWQRSLAAHVDPDRAHPAGRWCATTELPDLRSAHPLNEVMPLLRSTLVSIADEAMHVMLVTDADGIDPVARGRGQAAARGRRRRAWPRAPSWSEEVDRHQRDGHHAGRRRAGADPLGRAPGAHLPRLDLRRGARARPRHRRHPRRHRHQRPAAHHAPGDGPAGLGHRAAGREPAAGAAGHRRRAAAGAQHAAPRQPARAGRARWSRRAAGSSPASRTGSGRNGSSCRAGARPGARSPTAARWRSSRWPRATCCASAQRASAAARRSALSLRFMADGAPTAVLNGTAAPAHAAPGRAAHRAGPAPRRASPPSGWRCCSTARTATPPPCAARSCGCAG